MKSKAQFTNPASRSSVRVQRVNAKSQKTANLNPTASFSIGSTASNRISAEGPKSTESSFSFPWKSMPLKVTSCPSTLETNAVSLSNSGGPSGGLEKHSTRSRDRAVFHLSIAFQKLSLDEAMFVFHVVNWGLDRAIRMANGFGYKLVHSTKELCARVDELEAEINKQHFT